MRKLPPKAGSNPELADPVFLRKLAAHWNRQRGDFIGDPEVQTLLKEIDERMDRLQQMPKEKLWPSAEAQFALAKALEFGTYDEPDYPAAARWYLAAAEQELPKAQCNLGMIYARGLIDGKGFQDANYWFGRSAASGYPRGQFNFAVSYLNGNGLEKNPRLALEWALKAAEQDDKAAQCLVGQMYAQGTVGDIDVYSASFWLHKAATAGDVEAMYRLGNLHFSLTDFQHWDGKEAAHVGDSIVWYSEAANRGHKEASQAKERLRAIIPKPLFTYYESLSPDSLRRN